MTENTQAPIHFVLVRGLIREAAHWGELPARLLRAFPAARVSCLELPGAGALHPLRSPSSVPGMVTALRQQFLQARQPGETAILLAISLGGMIAAHWLHQHPADFQRAVLINTSFGGVSPLFHRLRPAALGGMALAAVAPQRHKEAAILRLVSNHPDAQADALPLWNRIRAERPVSTANTLRQLWAATRFRLGDARPGVPVLLLAGTCDRLVNVECSRAIARHWGVPLLEHGSGGHDLPLDDPDWIVNKTHEFIHDSAGNSGVR